MNRLQALARSAVTLLVITAACLSGGCTGSEKEAAPPAQPKLSTLDDLHGRRIGVLLGSVDDRYTAKHYPDSTILQFKSPPDIVLAVKAGKVDAAFYAREPLREMLRSDRELGMIADTVEEIPIGIGFNRGNRQLREEFNVFLAQLKRDGVYADMVERWVTRGDTRMPDITLSDAGTELVVGNVSDKGMPFTAVKDGRPIGFDVELAERFAAHLGRKIRFADMEFGSLIPAVATNKVDMVVSTLMITPERQKQIDFSDPYYQLGTSVFALRKNIVPHSSGGTDTGRRPPLVDLEDKRIAVLLGSAIESFAIKAWPRAAILQYKSSSEMVLAVKTGKVDVVLYDTEPLKEILRSDHQLAQLDAPGLPSFPLGIGFNLQNSQLRDRFNAFLGQIKSDGIYRDMVERWMNNGDSKMPPIPPSAPGTKLVVGVVSDTGYPFTIVQDNQLVGFDIELCRRFAAYFGRELILSPMEFGALIPAVAARKVDMIAGSIFITDERKKRISFSDPYYESGNSLLVLKQRAADAPSTATAGAQESPSGSAAPGIAGIQELNGKRIAVLTGSAGDLAARRHFPKALFQDFTASADAGLAVKTGKVDAFVYDKSVLLNLVRSNPELVILDEAVDKLEVAATLRKDNHRLLAEINLALRELKDDGTLRRLRTTWVDTPYATPPPLPAATTAGSAPPLRMGTSANFEPFSFHASDGLTGLDIALGRLLGARLGRSVDVIDMNFDALIPALQAGKIDFALANFNVTEERKKLIAYSLPYIENDISALVRRNTPAAPPPDGDRPASFLARVADSFHSNIIKEKRYLLLWDGLKTTAVISIFATLFGTLLGGLVCFMRLSKRRALELPARFFIAILRGMPVLVLLMLIFYVVFASVQIDPVLVAVIAFGMNFAAYAAEIFRSGIEGIERGQSEAGIALGFTRTATFIHIILPQMLGRILPVYKGEFISLVKMTSIVGYIAVQDLTKASDIIRSRTFDAFFPLVMVALLYFLVSWTLMQSLDYLERRTDPKVRRGRRIAG